MLFLLAYGLEPTGRAKIRQLGALMGTECTRGWQSRVANSVKSSPERQCTR